jgi:integrase
VRFDAALLLRQFRGKPEPGNRLKTGGKMSLQRYQQGYVYKRGKKKKVWYGMFREDVPKPDGNISRRQRNVRLGTVAELPTKNAADEKLSDLLKMSSPCVEMTFRELAERWKDAEGPTMKTSSFQHYASALRAYVVPFVGDEKIAAINREKVQRFLAGQAANYSASSLHTMKVVMSLVLGWAVENGWLERNPCAKVKLPRQTHGKKVKRRVLMPREVNALAANLHEPYSTLVLFLTATGLRIGEAIAVKWSDFEGDVLQVVRRIYEGDEDKVKSDCSVRTLPIELCLQARMRQLGGKEFVFSSRRGTPINPGNALRRFIRPAANKLGISLGGWHDFRHTLATTMRRNGVHPKVISGILGHAKVSLAMDTYDHADVEDFRQPLAVIAGGLLPSVTKSGSPTS